MRDGGPDWSFCGFVLIPFTNIHLLEAYFSPSWGKLVSIVLDLGGSSSKTGQTSFFPGLQTQVE